MDWIVGGLSFALIVAGIAGIFAATSAEARDRDRRARGLLTPEEQRQLDRIKRRRAEMVARDK